MNSEERSNDRVALWSCPECAFTFDAAHTDTDGGGYSCPLCAEIDLESRLAAALARIAAVEAYCKGRAISAHARGDSDAERAWLDALIVSERAALAASPTPTGPEPAKRPCCARPGWCACDPLTPGDEHCQWFGPATPTGPEPEDGCAECTEAGTRNCTAGCRPTGPETEQQALEADAMLEPSPSAMLAGIHITRRRVQDCACRGKHEHRHGYTEDCAVRDCTCDGGPATPEPTEETP